jgi:hypothetical protein
MTQHSLLIICMAALLAVVVLLGLLAAIIRLLTLIFPEPPAAAHGRHAAADADPAMIAAIHATAALVHPRTRITRIEEIR